MTMRWALAVIALLIFLSAPARAIAQAVETPHEDDGYDVADASFQVPGEDDEDDAAEEAAEREEDAYEEGTDAIDEEQWSRAVGQFDRVAAMNGKRLDAALYWKAYALNRQGRRAEAQSALAQLKAKAPQSKWLDDARALEIEMQKGSGQPPSAEAQSDEEMKLLAINSLMNGDDDEAVPMLEKFLAGNSSVKLKKKALFVLSQGDSPRARQVVTEIARGKRSPQLQSEALKYLGLFGGDESRQALADIYASTADVDIKKQVLHGFMLSGDKARVIAAARGEKDPALRDDAVRTLGVMGASDELWQMYKTETSVPVRKSILHALFVGGAADRLGEAVRTERDPVLRAEAIHSLGLTGSPRSAATLLEVYKADGDVNVRQKVLHALFLQGNSGALVQIARAETNPELRKAAVHWLSLMDSKEATAYMLEILNK
jgi:HEAT repeat protein